jgi:hypothetical protein
MSSSPKHAFAAFLSPIFGTSARLSCLHRMCQRGVVMDILGHSQLAMTTDIYSQVMPTALRAAADAMARPCSAELNCVAVSVAVNEPPFLASPAAELNWA